MGADVPGFREIDVTANSLSLHCRLGGDLDGPPVLLQHGWAGTSYSWRHVAPILAESGCAVLVPDLRGYGDSEKPAGSDGYDGRSLAEDSRGLVEALDFGRGRRLVVAAHDMGAPGALLWAAAYPAEIAGLLYIEEPVLLPAILRDLISYDERAAATGSMWWWLLALTSGAAEQIIVGNERRYLEWFYDRVPGTRGAIGDAIEEYLRTFRSNAGVLGALGVYRAAPETARQTELLRSRPVTVPVVGVGGTHSRGDAVATWLAEVCSDVDAAVIDGGHFLPEERPDQLASLILRMVRSA